MAAMLICLIRALCSFCQPDGVRIMHHLHSYALGGYSQTPPDQASCHRRCSEHGRRGGGQPVQRAANRRAAHRETAAHVAHSIRHRRHSDLPGRFPAGMHCTSLPGWAAELTVCSYHPEGCLPCCLPLSVVCACRVQIVQAVQLVLEELMLRDLHLHPFQVLGYEGIIGALPLLFGARAAVHMRLICGTG